VHSHVHPPRGLAIGLVGIAIGAALGAASLSWQRALNGAIGGAVGGFVGGFLFDYFSSDSGSGVFPRLVALLVTGLLIGGSMGLIETARREHWLEILSGGMAGKQFILYNQQTTIGADAGCQVTLIKDPAIAPRHALLTRSASGLTVRSVDPASPALVNGQPVHEHLLADSDMLQLGLSMLRYRSKASSAPVQAGIHG
jgi:Inner membrane component of T3SS, cytoplasmic domain